MEENDEIVEEVIKTHKYYLFQLNLIFIDPYLFIESLSGQLVHLTISK